jgi:hypothetical protein
LFPKTYLPTGKYTSNQYHRAVMQDDTQKRILGAFLIVLRPMARILLRFGIGFREFSEIAKIAFVDVASSDYGLRGRPTNTSRVAVMTGLTRKEVKRLRDKLSSGQDRLTVKSTPMCEVLHRWHAEEDFIDNGGRPAKLPFAGKFPSFSDLVRRYGGDIPPGAMRTELKRVGAVHEDDDGNLRVIRRTVRPALSHDNLIAALAHSAYPLLTNIAHNLVTKNQDERWAQFTAFTRSVKKSDVRRLHRISFDRLENIVETFDDLFIAYEALHSADDDKGPCNTIAVGVFYFEDTDDSHEFDW